MAENNQLRTIPLRAPRGVLFDRNGKVLVENADSFTIAIVREQSPNPRDLSDAVRRLAAATGVDEAHIADVVRRHRHEASFRPIPVIEHASSSRSPPSWRASWSCRKSSCSTCRRAPTPKAGSPPTSSATSARFRNRSYSRSNTRGSTGAIVGQAGLESTYNAQLMGKDGAKYVTVNCADREIEERGEEEPEDGARLKLTIDYDLQRALETAYKALGLDGAAVFLDPRNGDVLAMTSQPEYDPNDFANGLGPEEWTALTTDPSRPLQNRLIQGRYSPGSTFKVLMAVAALSEGLITPDYQCHLHGLEGVLRPRVPLRQEGRARHARPAARDRALVRRVLLHGRQPDEDRHDPPVRRAARVGGEDRHRPAGREREPRALDRVEDADGARRSGTRARRSRSASARARCRSRRLRSRA